jgi:hypothetical protein
VIQNEPAASAINSKHRVNTVMPAIVVPPLPVENRTQLANFYIFCVYF